MRPEPDPSKVITTQTDFSAGELDVDVKRGDSDPDRRIETALKTGGRQMSNWRILNSRKITNRSGRRALYSPAVGSRVERVLMSPGNLFDLVFTPQGALQVYDSTGARVFNNPAFTWTANTLGQIVWTQYKLTIWITFQNTPPLLLTWDGVSTWATTFFGEAVTPGNQKRTLFYRIAPKNVTMQVSDKTGAVSVAFSDSVALAGWVNTRIRFCGRQILVTGYTNPTTVNGTVIEPLPTAQRLTVGTDPRTIFNVGDPVRGDKSQALGIVLGMSATQMDVQLLSSVSNVVTQQSGGHTTTGDTTVTTIGFQSTENVVGAGGADNITAVAAIAGATGAVSVWDQEVMNSFQGWPASVFFDQNRLGLTNFPAVPGGIAWSAAGVFNDFYVDASTPAGAIFELAPNNNQVYFVVPGPESGEFVFCSRNIFYIPITAAQPLVPGSVAFNILSSDGAAQVQPRPVEEIIFYVTTSGHSVRAVIAPGAYYRPFNTREATELRDHLFSNIVAIAVPTATGTFPERYVYALNADGSLAVGKYTVADGVLKGDVGWLPWSGNGTVKWISALAADVIFSSSYAPNGITPVGLVEILDDTRHLDASQLYNTQPTGLPKPGGKGPLWWLAGGSVDLMDGPAGTRMMGTYQVDANGFLVPQNNAGEDFTSANLVVGQAWSAMFEPFVPALPAGENRLQRLWKRKIAKWGVYVQNSTGFVMVRFYSGVLGRNLPALGTIMQMRRIPTWNIDDDPTQPPPLREQAYDGRTIGRSHDPRVGILKDTPGPLTILEFPLEVTG